MPKRIWSLTIIVVVVAALTSSIFTVKERKQALLFQMGHLKTQHNGQINILQPGLHIKWPFIEKAYQFDMKIQSLPLNVPARISGSSLEGTAEYVVLWEISNLPLFYQRTGDNWQQANTLLTQTLRGHLELAPDKWNNMIGNEQASKLGAELGVNIISIQYKGLALSQNSLKTVYQMMSDLQEQQAKRLRVDGKLEADKVINDAQTQAEIILAQAQSDASKLHADGDAQAAKIYSDAYSKDPEFYAFLISLQAYAKTFTDKKDVIVLTPTMQFFNYFNQPQK